jgi:RNA polymerase sigma-70 factor (ECF subfamily)
MEWEGTADGVADARVGSEDSDLRLVERVKAGDQAAYSSLVHKYKGRIYSVIYNMTSNREDANDLAQETFIKAFRSLDRFRGRSQFFTWLYRIAVNATLSHLKKNRLRHFFNYEDLQEETANGEWLEAMTSASRSDRPVFLRELQEKLNEALQQLSPKHRAVVVLFEVEGMSHEEIAEILKVSTGTVRSRLHYAKQQLQALLQSYVR